MPGPFIPTHVDQGTGYDREFDEDPHSVIEDLMHSGITPELYYAIKGRLSAWIEKAFQRGDMRVEPYYWLVEFHGSRCQIYLCLPRYGELKNGRFLGHHGVWDFWALGNREYELRSGEQTLRGWRNGVHERQILFDEAVRREIDHASDFFFGGY
jgi:hypothetical protein